ncbi:hypothetical protein CEUSTIGMA_g7210.t1 [Chlamydomonas eustigma]|uniref:FAD-binding PCMH-type domain-containing protein n=1 Tax=Chlamydomonas eustigma TaxID=1157962 RepID=A0A250XAI4_9CHLO|nr:hypothetical protein CEUSTIGMA_g7210.t1 [Chlamydomonas eustigma]|eukprot:GAX79770.1 hypothetical protein CEUSTIGMA_g7210.t1 [Chlamydomonas eustigma]
MLLYLLITSLISKSFALNDESRHPVSSSLQNAFHWQGCHEATHIHHPQSTDEVADLISVFHRDATITGHRYQILSSHNNFYRHNNLSCAEGEATSIMLDISDMNQMLHLDKSQGTITVQSGMLFEDLEELLLSKKLSLAGWFVAPLYAGMSLASIIETASHGSSLVGSASMSSVLRTAVLVDGTGLVIALDSPGELLEGSLGLFGVITEVTLQVTEARKVSVLQVQQEDVYMLEEIRDVIENSQALSIDITWSPAAALYTTRVWHAGDVNMEGDSVHAHMMAPQGWLEKVDGMLFNDEQDKRDEKGIMCEIIGDMTGYHALGPHKASMQQFPIQEQTKEEGEKSAEPEPSQAEMVVGWINRLASTRCVSSDGRDCLMRHVKVTPHTIAIASEHFASWMDDVRDILDFSAACSNFLFHFQFVTASETPLALSSGRQIISIDIQSFRSLKGYLSSSSHDLPVPSKHQDLLEEILLLTLCKYKGRPHWALSTNRMLLGSPCSSTYEAYGAERFSQVMGRRMRYDPQGLFFHPAVAKIVGMTSNEHRAGCAANEECFCSEDKDCGAGFECAPGHSFPEYYVCRTKRAFQPDEL